MKNMMEANNNNEVLEGGNFQNQEVMVDDVSLDADPDPDSGATEGENPRAMKKENLNSILEMQDSFPIRQRIYIDGLVDGFLEKLKNDIHEMICDQKLGNDYRGLDVERDTEAEVEVALRFFPENLSTRQKTIWSDEEGKWVDADEDYNEGDIPIQCLLHQMDETDGLKRNWKAIPFIHLFARLATEFGSFEKDKRGGLLVTDCTDYNVFMWLVEFEPEGYDNETQKQRMEELLFLLLTQLRRTGLFQKQDIRNERLVDHVSIVNIVRFLVGWDPTSLLTSNTDRYETSPLESSAILPPFETFETFFDCYVKYFPKKTGLLMLFQNNTDSIPYDNRGYKRKDVTTTPFQSACERFQRQNVVQTVEDTLARYSSETPLHTADAMMMAAVDPNYHLDCVYFIMRRQPIILINMLRSFDNNGSNGGNNNDDENVDDDDDGFGSGGDGSGGGGDYRIIIGNDVAGIPCNSKKRKWKRNDQK